MTEQTEIQNNSIRVKFERGEEVKYISHLDLMKTFERAIRRARIPIAYSQGFNPHPMMVFGLPLSVGVTSESEYGDFEFASPIEPDEFKETLNKTLPSGIRIIEAAKKTDKSNIMATITKGSYRVIVDIKQEQNGNNLEEMIRSFLENSEIIIEKEGKNGVRSVDIRPNIYNMKAVDNFISQSSAEGNKKVAFNMLVGAGSANNLKPELVIAAMSKMFSIEMETKAVHRTGLFIGTGNETINPLDGKNVGSFSFPE